MNVYEDSVRCLWVVALVNLVANKLSIIYTVSVPDWHFRGTTCMAVKFTLFYYHYFFKEIISLYNGRTSAINYGKKNVYRNQKCKFGRRAYR